MQTLSTLWMVFLFFFCYGIIFFSARDYDGREIRVHVIFSPPLLHLLHNMLSLPNTDGLTPLAAAVVAVAVGPVPEAPGGTAPDVIVQDAIVRDATARDARALAARKDGMIETFFSWMI